MAISFLVNSKFKRENSIALAIAAPPLVSVALPPSKKSGNPTGGDRVLAQQPVGRLIDVAFGYEKRIGYEGKAGALRAAIYAAFDDDKLSALVFKKRIFQRSGFTKTKWNAAIDMAG